MSEKQAQAIREAWDVNEFVEHLGDWLKVYVRDHPDVSMASIQAGLRLMASDFALSSTLVSPPPKDKKA